MTPERVKKVSKNVSFLLHVTRICVTLFMSGMTFGTNQRSKDEK